MLREIYDHDPDTRDEDETRLVRHALDVMAGIADLLRLGATPAEVLRTVTEGFQLFAQDADQVLKRR